MGEFSVRLYMNNDADSRRAKELLSQISNIELVEIPNRNIDAPVLVSADGIYEGFERIENYVRFWI
jgi:hypothetical protein